MNKTSWGLLALVFILFALYLPLDSPKSSIYDFKSAIDDYIPLWTGFVIIYISYAIYLGFTFWYFYKKNKPRDLNIVLAAITLSCSLAYLIYIFYQNSIIRPQIIERNIFDSIYTQINLYVPPYNAFPSLHVAISTVCALGYWSVKSKLFKSMAIWTILIIISTVLTKQHYFLDILGGLLLATVTFYISRVLFKSEQVH
jgi:membrane-associated phospholipid phosphatase